MQNTGVTTIDLAVEDEGRNAVPALGPLSLKTTRVASDTVYENLLHFLRTFEHIFEAVDAADSSFMVDEVTLNLVVNAGGGIELVGKVSGSVESSISVTLRRKSDGAGPR